MTISDDDVQKENSKSAAALVAAAKQYKENGDFKRALEKLFVALKLYPQACSTRGKLLNNMGHLQVSMGMSDAALLSFSESALIYGEIKNPLEQGRQLGNVGSVHRDQKEYDEALVTYRRSIAALQKANHPVDLANQYSNLAYVYARMENAVEAVKWYQKAKQLYGETGQQERAARVGKNIEVLLSMKSATTG